MEVQFFCNLPDVEYDTIDGPITFWRSLCADDSAFAFTSRADAINGISLLYNHLGLLMHVGTKATSNSKGSKSKQERCTFLEEWPMKKTLRKSGPGSEEKQPRILQPLHVRMERSRDLFHLRRVSVIVDL
uniref:Uncharacterized protein n=1 Tax=Leptocylindrus danicus TaxID=163516 RepID=A0A7S2L6C7_9STRA|mmetsp:Transcript_32180/g.46773  ORF Transcript_32180/g.46773 Transcript_32180/m.46773 type:complete len:130 (+) Transcript_32180:269-658(+)